MKFQAPLWNSRTMPELQRVADPRRTIGVLDALPIARFGDQLDPSPVKLFESVVPVPVSRCAARRPHGRAARRLSQRRLDVFHESGECSQIVRDVKGRRIMVDRRLEGAVARRALLGGGIDFRHRSGVVSRPIANRSRAFGGEQGPER